MIKNLPPELLAEVFLQCIPGKFPTWYPHEAPLVLAHICSAWHRLAPSTPRLWASISFEYFTWDAIPKKRTRVLDAWIERSASYLLSPEVTCSQELYIKKVKPHLHQIEVLSLTLLADTNPPALPKLLTKTVMYDLYFRSPFREYAVEFVDMHPESRVVRLHLHSGRLHLHLNDGMRNLKELVITPESLNHCLDTLRVCPTLQALSVDVTHFTPSLCRPPEVQTLAQITFLVIKGLYSDDVIGAFLNRLQLRTPRPILLVSLIYLAAPFHV